MSASPAGRDWRMISDQFAQRVMFHAPRGRIEEDGPQPGDDAHQHGQAQQPERPKQVALVSPVTVSWLAVPGGWCDAIRS